MFPYCTITIVLPKNASNSSELEKYVLKNYLARDTVQSIRQALTAYCETCAYTSFSFTKEDGTLVSDFVEICTLIPVPQSASEADAELFLTLKIKLDRYTKKTALEHVHLVKQYIENSSALRSFNSMDESIDVTTTEQPKKAYPVLADMVGNEYTVDEDPKLEDFLAETLLCFADKTSSNGHSLTTPLVSDIIKAITFSGYNPPSPQRIINGDFFYLEVSTASEGLLFITATANGFYVTKSSRVHFDPSPASNAAFSHELLLTLLLCSSKLRDAWKAILCRPVPSSRPPLRTMLALHEEGRVPSALISQWLDIDVKPTAYSLSRAFQDYSDRFGMDEHSAPREWNEEFQSVRSMFAKGEMDKITTSKYSHKIHSDFYESCVRVVRAVVDGGQITPLNPLDPLNQQVYIYNNLFVSRSAESSDLFKLTSGEAAVRKSAGHDHANIAVIESLDIPDLCFVKNHVFDYKGSRVVVQAILPGIVATNAPGARLMLGALECGNRLKVKSAAYGIMKQIADKLSIAERKVTAVPIPSVKSDIGGVPEPAAFTEEEPTSTEELTPQEIRLHEHKLAVMSAKATEAIYNNTNTEDAPQTVIIDDEDEAVPISEPFVPVAGPVEAKILKGTDNRMYMLEALRITPRDANYVPKSSGGTGKISEEYLEKVEASGIGPVYLLRRELLQSFRSRKSEAIRQQLLGEAFNNLRVAKETSVTSVKDVVVISESTDAEVLTDESEVMKTADPSPSSPAEAAAESITESELSNAFAELVKDPKNVELLNAENIPLNVNSFLSFDGDADAEVAKADEAKICEISQYLYDSILPLLTDSVRQGNSTPFDGDDLKTTLHGFGINMRYLGRLAELAQQQEQIDIEHSQQSPPTRRVRGMPFYWLELLETEIIARAFKIALNSFLSVNEDIRNAPSKTITSMLNAILGAPTSETDADISESTKPTKSKSKKLKSQNDVSLVLPSLPDAVISRETFIDEFNDIIRMRYNYKLTLLNASPEISRILSRAPVLRRICKLSGIRILSRNYVFEDANSFNLLPNPVCIDDIVGLSPILKGEKAHEFQPVKEIREMLQAAQGLLRNNLLDDALSVAQEANNWIQQVIPFTHVDATTALDIITGVLLAYREWETVAMLTEKNISLWAHLKGFDCREVVHLHLQCGIAKTQLGDFVSAISHLKTSHYLINLIGGPRHPDHVTVLMQLASVYKLNKLYNGATQSILRAHYKISNGGCCDQKILSYALSEMAEVFAGSGNMQEAVRLQTNSYRIAKQLFEVTDETLAARKKKLEEYIRDSAIEKVNKQSKVETNVSTPEKFDHQPMMEEENIENEEPFTDSNGKKKAKKSKK